MKKQIDLQSKKPRLAYIGMDKKTGATKRLCDNPVCAKCLSSNCQDRRCSIHTNEHKETWRRRWENANKKPFPHPKNYINRIQGHQD